MKGKKGLIILLVTGLLASCEKEEISRLPIVETAVTEVSIHFAKCLVTIKDEGSSTVTSKGVYFSATNQTPGPNDTKMSCSSQTVSISLEPATTYYVRAYATNSVGTSYGQTISFETEYITVKDIDGRSYRTMVIGSQTWMIDNLKVTNFNDGSSIPYQTGGSSWDNISGTTEPAFCFYSNDVKFNDPYGAIYNWHAAHNPKLCPVGWHVPTYAEWQTLINFLGGASVAGGKMKATGTTYWQTPNTGASNSSKFNALPSGGRAGTVFGDMKTHAYFWPQDDFATGANLIILRHNTALIETGVVVNKAFGAAIRCVKN